VLILTEHLKLVPDSRVRALTLGGIQFLGWDTAMYAQANLYDLIASLAAGLGGKKLKSSSRYPRPTEQSEQTVAPTIAAFNVAEFMNRLSS